MKVTSKPINLKHFISKKMRMSHIYQPVMIKTLLENGGAATTEEIATSLLAYDQSQLEYYSLRTKNMVGKVLTNNGVVEPIKNGRQITGYRLTEATHTEAQIAALQTMCDEAINAYISKRGEAIWGHRGPDSGYVSGSIRYNVLKRAKHRCELCGGHEEQGSAGELLPPRRSRTPDRCVRRVLQQSALPREPEQRHTCRRLLRARQSHSQRKGKDQETDNPTTPLATSKTSRIINHTNEPEPPMLKPL